ncbi:MAG: hypothetical protein RI981_416 [Bacteroidota bacterium]
MINRFLFLVWVSVVLFSCEKAQDTKGETIPPQGIFQKSQNPELFIAYLSNLIESQDGANLYYLRSKAYFELRSYQKAQVDIEKALNQVPGDVDYLLLSAQIKKQLGLYTEGLEDAKLVESSGITSAKLYLTLAELFFATHEKKVGLMYIRKLEKAGVPKSEFAYVQFLKHQFRSDSLGAYQRITPENLQHPDLSHAYFLHQIGRSSNLIYQKQILGELKKFPFDPYLMFSWGQFLVQMGHLTQAEKVFSQSLIWMPQHVNMRLKVVRYYIDQKRFDLAEHTLAPILSNTLFARDILYLKVLLAINRGEKTKSNLMLDSIRKVYAGDVRFAQLQERLIGKKNDSLKLKQDSLQQIAP